MRWFLFLPIVLFLAVPADAQLFWKGGIEYRKGIFGERLRAPAGTNVCMGPCGIKLSGPICSPCGPMAQQQCGQSTCGQSTYGQQCSPQQYCGNSCTPNASAYATAPYGQAAQAIVTPQAQVPVFYSRRY